MVSALLPSASVTFRFAISYAGRSFFKEGLISRSLLLKSLYAQLMFQLMGADEEKMERMRQEAARLTAGWDQDKVRSVVTEVLEEVMSPLIYAEALELMHDHRAAGRLICIVSSSPEEVVEPLAKMLAVDRFIATKPQIVDGKYTVKGVPARGLTLKDIQWVLPHQPNGAMLEAIVDALGVPELYALTSLSLESYDPADCLLCRSGVPINTRVGKGGGGQHLEMMPPPPVPTSAAG